MARGQSAVCPFCKGKHRSKKAFNACRKRHQQYVWTKEGIKVWK